MGVITSYCYEGAKNADYKNIRHSKCASASNKGGGEYVEKKCSDDLIWSEESKFQQPDVTDTDSKQYDMNEKDTQKHLNITYKCIQSASATQSGTSKGKSKVNQDSFICMDSFGTSSTFQLYGVCDGHGPDGHNVSQYVADKLPNIISNLLDKHNNNSITSILKQSFELIDIQLTKAHTANELNFDINYSGTTVTLGLFAEDKLYVANIGDSRTVLGKIADDHKSVPTAVALSIDHDPNNEREMERIEKSLYGKIVSDEYNDKRIEIHIPEIKTDKENDIICKQGKVQKVSASVSRSLGDRIGHKYGGLTSIPDIKIYVLSANDIFVIFASDGIWQMIDNDDVMRVIGTKLKLNKDVEIYDDLQKSTDKLVKEANVSWQDEYDDYTDDITCVIARIGK
eukprot:526800_1